MERLYIAVKECVETIRNKVKVLLGRVRGNRQNTPPPSIPPTVHTRFQTALQEFQEQVLVYKVLARAEDEELSATKRQKMAETLKGGIYSKPWLDVSTPLGEDIQYLTELLEQELSKRDIQAEANQPPLRALENALYEETETQVGRRYKKLLEGLSQGER